MADIRKICSGFRWCSQRSSVFSGKKAILKADGGRIGLATGTPNIGGRLFLSHGSWSVMQQTQGPKGFL